MLLSLIYLSEYVCFLTINNLYIEGLGILFQVAYTNENIPIFRIFKSARISSDMSNDLGNGTHK